MAIQANTVLVHSSLQVAILDDPMQEYTKLDAFRKKFTELQKIVRKSANAFVLLKLENNIAVNRVFFLFLALY